MITSGIHRLAVGLALLLCIPIVSWGEQPEEKSVWRLKRDVEERERQVNRAQCDLAEARARVALAEGQRETAIAELRKVVAGQQADVQWIKDHANWSCDPREELTQAQWNLSKSRVWLAEVAGDTPTLVAELKTIVGFHEQELARVSKLEQLLAAKPEDKIPVQQALDQARERLAAAEKKLAAEQTKKPEGVK